MRTNIICLKCGHVFDRSGNKTRVSQVKCPECGSEKIKTKVELEEGDEPNGFD